MAQNERIRAERQTDPYLVTSIAATSQQRDFSTTLLYLLKLRAAYEAYPDDPRTEALRRIVRSAVSIAERCADQSQSRDEKQQASDLAGWLGRSSRSRDHLTWPGRPELALQIGEDR